MSLRKENPTLLSSLPVVSAPKGKATLVVETTKKLKGQALRTFRVSTKARRQPEDDTPKALASWVSEVVDEGSGVILVRTSTGEHRLAVQEISVNKDMGGADPDMHPDVSKAVDLARARGAETAAQILDQEDMLSGEVIGERMGMSRQAVDKARKAGKLLAMEGSKRGFRYPEWQLDKRGVRHSGLLEVLDLTGNGWDAYRFFMATDRGIVNRELLAQGEVEEILRRAKLWVSGNYA